MLVIEGWLITYDQSRNTDRFDRDCFNAQSSSLIPLMVYPGVELRSVRNFNHDRFFKPYGWAKLKFHKKGIFCRCYIPDIDEILPECVPAGFVLEAKSIKFNFDSLTGKRIIYDGYLKSIALATKKNSVLSSSITCVRVIKDDKNAWKILDRLEKDYIGW